MYICSRFPGSDLCSLPLNHGHHLGYSRPAGWSGVAAMEQKFAINSRDEFLHSRSVVPHMYPQQHCCWPILTIKAFQRGALERRINRFRSWTQRSRHIHETMSESAFTCATWRWEYATGEELEMFVSRDRKFAQKHDKCIYAEVSGNFATSSDTKNSCTVSLV